MAKGKSTIYTLETGERVKIPVSCMRAMSLIVLEGIHPRNAAEQVGITFDRLKRAMKSRGAKLALREMSREQENVDVVRAKAKRGQLLDHEDGRVAMAAIADTIDRNEGKARQIIEQHSTHVETVRFIVSADTPALPEQAIPMLKDEASGVWKQALPKVDTRRNAKNQDSEA